MTVKVWGKLLLKLLFDKSCFLISNRNKLCNVKDVQVK